MEMTPEQRDKRNFVRSVLTVLLRQVLGNEHYYAEYRVDQNGEEYVEVTFDNEYKVREIDVTSDSLLALTRDVLKCF